MKYLFEKGDEVWFFNHWRNIKIDGTEYDFRVLRITKVTKRNDDGTYGESRWPAEQLFPFNEKKFPLMEEEAGKACIKYNMEILHKLIKHVEDLEKYYID